MKTLKKFASKSALTVATLAVVIAGAAAFSAFEAHIINVTAKIENALSVPTRAIDFGTVFPQEHLEKELQISLSGSFMAENRVDSVEYFLRQKPKCGITSNGGTVLDHASTATGHVVVDPQTGEVSINCGEAPRELLQGETYGVLPSLCEYISKHGPDENDGKLNSFHKPWEVVLTDSGYGIKWTDTLGMLQKSSGDTVDTWIIDLAVPTFMGHSAQDWEDFVKKYNPDANPDEYVLNPADEHKVFGCDLWVEVSGVNPLAPVLVQ